MAEISHFEGRFWRALLASLREFYFEGEAKVFQVIVRSFFKSLPEKVLWNCRQPILMFKTFKTKDKEAEKEIIITEGSGCGTVGTSGRFRQQMSAVRIQSSADMSIEHQKSIKSWWRWFTFLTFFISGMPLAKLASVAILVPSYLVSSRPWRTLLGTNWHRLVNNSFAGRLIWSD